MSKKTCIKRMKKVKQKGITAHSKLKCKSDSLSQELKNLNAKFTQAVIKEFKFIEFERIKLLKWK